MAASTPIGLKSCSENVIDIIDSDDEPDISHNVGASTTSFGAKSSSVIDIIDSDDEPDICQNISLDMKDSGNISLAECFAEEKGENLDNNPDVSQDMQGSGNISPSTCFKEEKGKNLDSNHAGNNEEILDVCEGILFTANTKRKRTCNVIKIESESDCDDDMRNSQTTVKLEADKVIDDTRIPSHRLKTLRKIKSKSRNDKSYQQSIPTNGDDELEEDLLYSDCEDLLCVVSRKRKPTRNVVLSESENDDEDDDLPISKLLRNHVKEISVDELVNVVDADGDDDDMPISPVIRRNTASRRRLKPLRKCVSKSHDDKVNNQQSIPTNDDVHEDDDESIDHLSQSEEGNLSDFINDDFELSNCDVTSNMSQDECDVESDDSNNSQDLQDHSNYSNLQDVSDEDMSFDEIKSKIQRKKKHKIKWENEGDMRADLGKDPVLCMKAVCVIYRQQTAGEQMVKGTLCRNGRGFNTHHARRGSELAEFLLDGSPDGSMNKTKEELEEFDPEGVEDCEKIAFYYSTQLFDIFDNKEDPFFP